MKLYVIFLFSLLNFLVHGEASYAQFFRDPSFMRMTKMIQGNSEWTEEEIKKFRENIEGEIKKNPSFAENFVARNEENIFKLAIEENHYEAYYQLLIHIKQPNLGVYNLFESLFRDFGFDTTRDQLHPFLLKNKLYDINFGNFTYLYQLVKAKNHQEFLKLCLEKGLDPNIILRNRIDLLTHAITINNTPLIKMILEKGYKLNKNSQNTAASTIDYALISTNYAQIVPLLIHHGLDANTYTRYGYPLLIDAITKGDEKFALHLIKLGADINLKDKKNHSTPLMFSAQAGLIDVSRELINQGADIHDVNGVSLYSVVDYAANGKDFKNILHLLVDNGLNPNFRMKDGIPVLHYAVKNNLLDLVKNLLKKGADINLRELNDGYTPLLYAFKYGQKDMIEFLLEQGAYHDVKTFHGKDIINVFYEFAKMSPLDLNEIYNKYLIDDRRIFMTKNKELKKLLDLAGIDESEKDDFIFLCADSSHPRVKLEVPLVEIKKAIKFLNTDTIKEVKSIGECSLCFNSFSERDVVIKNTGACSCLFCSECHQEFIDFSLEKNGANPLMCPGCNKKLPLRYALDLSLSGKNSVKREKVKTYAERFLAQALSQVPHFKFCSTANCQGGHVIAEGAEGWYECFLCEKFEYLYSNDSNGDGVGVGDQKRKNMAQAEENSVEEILQIGRLKADPQGKSNPQHSNYLHGKFRPCYYCGKVTERIDGCNSIKCFQCKKEWHYNYGDHQLHPDYNGKPVHDFNDDQMRFEPLQKAHF